MIWKKDFTLEQLNSGSELCNNPFDIEFIEKGDNFLMCKMPVNKNTKQPYGILHGGASVYLAETVGSVAGQMCAPSKKNIVGLGINANHLKAIQDGYVFAKAVPVHIGGKTHVWSIEIRNENQKMICICRLTLAVLSSL